MKTFPSVSLLSGILGLLLLAGCGVPSASLRDDSPSSLDVHKVVVVGFKAALSERDASMVVRDPLSGAVYMAEPVPGAAVEGLSERLYDWLARTRDFTLIPPVKAGGVLSSIMYSDKTLTMDAKAVFQRLGLAFEADAVLVGYVYRWREREGTDYAVDRPASVAFDLHLLRPSDGALLWGGKYDKTQTPLSENLFDISTFFKGKGRWMTAEGLGVLGLETILARMPGAPKAKED